jgi:hypothetical protein
MFPAITQSVVSEAIDEPKNEASLYGNTIAAPVFREIADKSQ